MNGVSIEIMINIIIFLVFGLASIFIVSRIKFQQKGYKYMFITYMFFWIPIMLVREYRGVVQELLVPNEALLISVVLASYGLIGILARPLSDFFSLRTNSRKWVLYTSVVIMILTTIPFIFYASTATNVIQTVGIGVGASMIGLYELMFKEQYTNNKSYLTVSILAIPPLLADFISSPIQSLVTIFENDNFNLGLFNNLSGYIVLWIIALFFFVITLFLIFFLKEDRRKIDQIFTTKNNVAIKSEGPNFSGSKKVVFFTLVFLIGSVVAFIKFSNSGAIALTTMSSLGQNLNIDVSNYRAYISLVFTVFQLTGSILIYYFSKKQKSQIFVFSIGISVWIVYHLLISFIQDPYTYFALTSLNGFAYGILYNLILGFALSLRFSSAEKHKFTPMGIYQGIIAIGISASSFFVTFLRQQVGVNGTSNFNQDGIFIINITLSFVCLFVFGIYLLIYYMSLKDVTIKNLATHALVVK